MPAATSCSAAAHPSSSARFPSGCSSTRWTTTSGRSSRARREGLPADAVAELRDVLPSLATAGSAPAPPDGRHRTHRAVRRLVEVLADPSPVVLLLDDVHWADAGSIELLDALLRRPPAAPALIAVAVRPRQLPERLSAALERTHRAGGLTRLELGPLSEAEARELLGAGVDGETASALYEESGGNPFYLEQLARASPRPARERAGVAGLPRRPTSRCRGAWPRRSPGSSPCCPRPPAGCSREPPWPAIPSSSSSPRPPRAFPRRPPCRPSTSCCAGTSSATRTSRGASASAIPSCGAPCTRRPRAAGASPRTRPPRRRWPRAAPPPWPAPTTSSARPGMATPPPAASCAKPPRRPSPARPPPPRACSTPPCGSWARDAPDRTDLLAASAHAHAAAGQFRAAHDRLLASLATVPRAETGTRVRLTATCARLENLLGHHREAHARLTAALEELVRRDVARRGRAHARAGGRRLLPHGLRRRCASGRPAPPTPHGRSATGR